MVVFLHVSVILSTGGSAWAGTPPGPGRLPWDQVHPPGPGTPPGSSACWEIRATSGRYACYWNAFLFSNITHTNVNWPEQFKLKAILTSPQ